MSASCDEGLNRFHRIEAKGDSKKKILNHKLKASKQKSSRSQRCRILSGNIGVVEGVAGGCSPPS